VCTSPPHDAGDGGNDGGDSGPRDAAPLDEGGG
jgi:hypothetical protein